VSTTVAPEGRKLLRRIFIDGKYTHQEREASLVVCKEDEILWLVGRLADRRYCLTPRTKTLLWGYSDKRMVTNIGQWLSMEPMAPPVVMFRLKRRPEELPIKTKLVSILETTEGKVLRDTLEVELR